MYLIRIPMAFSFNAVFPFSLMVIVKAGLHFLEIGFTERQAALQSQELGCVGRLAAIRSTSSAISSSYTRSHSIVFCRSPGGRLTQLGLISKARGDFRGNKISSSTLGTSPIRIRLPEQPASAQQWASSLLGSHSLNEGISIHFQCAFARDFTV